LQTGDSSAQMSPKKKKSLNKNLPKKNAAINAGGDNNSKKKIEIDSSTTDSDYSDVDTKKSQSPVSPKTPPLSLMPNKSAVKRKHEDTTELTVKERMYRECMELFNSDSESDQDFPGFKSPTEETQSSRGGRIIKPKKRFEIDQSPVTKKRKTDVTSDSEFSSTSSGNYPSLDLSQDEKLEMGKDVMKLKDVKVKLNDFLEVKVDKMEDVCKTESTSESEINKKQPTNDKQEEELPIAKNDKPANESSASNQQQPMSIKKKLLQRAQEASSEKKNLSCDDCGEKFKLKAFQNHHKKTKCPGKKSES